MNSELPLDDSWKKSPAEWSLISASEHAKLIENVSTMAGKGLLRVTLNLRSPKATPGLNRFHTRTDDDENGDATVRYVTGVLLDPKTVLVLAEMKSSTTGRLERIRVRQASGQFVDAKFVHTLADYGAFVSTLGKPLEGAFTAPKADIRALRGTFLPAAQVVVQGEKRTEYFSHRRIASFDLGFHRQLHPDIGGDANNVFLFDESGALVALPITRRAKVSSSDDQPNGDPKLTPVAYLREAVAGLPKTADPGNMPLSEDQENRLAWLGVELQGLNPQLARANDVSNLTNDGSSGALVTHVCPDSPAAKAGVDEGWILIRAHVEGEPQPLEVKVEPYQFSEQPFPWERFDELPEQFFDQVPRPWPPAENTLTRALTDLGFGRSFEAEFFHDGKVERKSFKVAESPAHFDSAKKYKCDPLGVTARELSYEVRRYFQIDTGEPGVIISKIEMGSKASTAGLKPFELITHVNDQPVKSAVDFEKLTKDRKELRLSVKRMTNGRQVRVKLDGATSKPAPAKKAQESE
jgi:hypothetical protein